jgi:hypothetical protein
VGIDRRKVAFQAHRSSSASRGIQFLLTFEEWWEIWQASGHWHERGPGRDKYCMARFGDRGSYAVGNVDIITNRQNAAERGGHSLRDPVYHQDRAARAVRISARVGARKRRLKPVAIVGTVIREVSL